MVAEQINQIVDMIARKLGVATEAVYPMLLKQADVFCSIYSVTLWITGIAFALLIAFIITVFIADDKYIEPLFYVSVAGIVVCVLIFITAGVIALRDFTEYFTALHNPDWWAIEYVAKLLT